MKKHSVISNVLISYTFVILKKIPCCKKETVVSGVKTYIAGAYYLDFSVFKTWENTVSGCYVVRWRELWFAV